MLLTVFAVLLVLWLLGFTVFHVASGLIHLLLVLAVIAIVMHFMGARRAVMTGLEFQVNRDLTTLPCTSVRRKSRPA